MDKKQDYNPAEWFWIVNGDETRYWSSAVAAYVKKLPSGAGVTRITDEASLTDVLANYGLSGPLVRKVDVGTERERRLALGFSYDFGDARGVHRIGTTPADMLGWNEVTMAADAIIDTNAPFSLNIMTNTGPATVTPLEWKTILLYAAGVRQPIWQASFALEAMDPIPLDYRDDKYWGAAWLLEGFTTFTAEHTPPLDQDADLSTGGTPEQKLAAFGLTVDELKALLGL